MILTARAHQLALATLTGDATLTAFLTGGIYLREAPQSVVPPFGILAHQTALPDIQSRGGALVMGRGQMTFTVWGFPVTTVATLVPAADRADTLLNAALGAAGGATIIRIIRDHELYLKAPVGATGIEMNGVGAVYQWWAQ
jgi:hypothetical protein